MMLTSRARRLDDDPQNTVGSCTSRCRESGFAYAGLRNGTQCYCGHLQPTDNAAWKVRTHHCDVGCPGTTDKDRELCGGATQLSGYYVQPRG